jgi:long-chain fatty acid transport protein
MLGRTANAFGYGFSLGALYEVNEMIRLGFTYKSKQDFTELEYQLRQNDIKNFPDGDGGYVSSKNGTYKMDLDFPRQASLGLRVAPMDGLNVSADVKWINWSDTMDDLAVTGDFNGGFNSSGGSTNKNAALDPGWDDQIVYALGANYEVMPNKLQVRAGYNYSEAPIEKGDVFSNLLLPAMTEQHLSLGATYFINNHWDLSFAYMKAFDNSVTGEGDVPESYQALFGKDSQAKINLEETSYSFNIGYKF